MSRLTSAQAGLILLSAMLLGARAADVKSPDSLAETQERNIRARGVQQWAKDLDSGDSGTGLAVVHAMEVMGPSTQGVVPVLVKALRHPEPEVRGYAIRTLARFGQAANSAIPAVREATSDRETRVRIVAACALWTLGNDGTAIPVLIQALNDVDPASHGLAAEALGQIGPPARAALPSLIQRLRDESVQTRVWVVEAIPKIGGNPQQLFPALLQGCGDSHCNVRRSAAQSLGKIGPNAKPGIPTLIRLLDDLHGTVRVAAAEALWNIEKNPAAIAKIAAELSTDVQTQARIVIASSPHDVGPTVYRDDAFTDIPAAVHQAAIDAVVRIAPAAPQAVVVLRDIKRQTERSVHVRAAVALEKIVPNEDPLPTLIAALTSSKYSVRIEAANVLREMGPRTKSATPALLQAMHRCADEASRVPRSTDSEFLETLRTNFETNSAVSHCQAWLNMVSALREIDPKAAAEYESGPEYQALRNYIAH